MARTPATSFFLSRMTFVQITMFLANSSSDWAGRAGFAVAAAAAASGLWRVRWSRRASSMSSRSCPNMSPQAVTLIVMAILARLFAIFRMVFARSAGSVRTCFVLYLPDLMRRRLAGVASNSSSHALRHLYFSSPLEASPMPVPSTMPFIW
ncbi:hypothetical protein D3C87_1538890 [compost metagenome]